MSREITFDHPRPEWEDPDDPVDGPAFFWSNIREIAVHYPGCDCDNIPDGDLDEPWSEFPEYMRAMQRAYLRRGYSIGYNAVGDARGHGWEGRGDTFRNAANVGRKFDWNRNYDTISYKFAVDFADPASPDAIVDFQNFVAECRAAAGRFLPINPHSYYDWTACPGEGIRAQIDAGVFEPNPTPDLITSEEEDTMWLVARTSDTGDRWLASPGPRRGAFHVPTEVPRDYPFADGGAFDIGSGEVVANWGRVTKIPQKVALQYMGPEV